MSEHYTQLFTGIAADILSSELHALYIAVDIRFRNEKEFVIFSDSASSLQSIDNRHSVHAVVKSKQYHINHLATSWKSITFCWFSSHVGIPRNEKVEIAAVSAGLRLPK